jgi:hypothetical protein
VTAPSLPLQSWAACLAWIADNFVAAVHGSQDPAEIALWWGRAATLTSPDGRDPRLALAVLLAAGLSPDRPVEKQALWVDRLGWELDEERERHGREIAS